MRKLWNTLEKGRLDFTRIDIAWTLQTILFSLSKAVNENQEFTNKKRRFNRFVERDASGNLLGSTVYFE